ncbi:MAG: histidine kinase [Pseudomonadota bacterium]|nr:histidine kinase [Pseudomonadota bacterium]MDQ3160539.1 histidine kinase [Pseudomonadota bacterium]
MLRAKQAELEALQARIRPHFLFNTLNTGAALIRGQPGAAETLLLDLADLFRAALAAPHEITLAEELGLTRRYLEIEALRFGDRLQTHWDLPDPLPAVLVPALSIQPLAENAIRHGIESSAEGGQLAISVDTDDQRVRISVRNPIRAGFTTGLKGHQVGLASVRARIEAVSHGMGRLETRVEDDCYVATLTIPTSHT